MSKTLLVYADEATASIVKKAVGRKGNIIQIENLSHIHKACRNIPADALFIGEEEWDVFGCTALHPMIAPYIHFPIIMVISHLADYPGKREVHFRFVSIPEEQRSRTEATGYQATLRPFLRFLSPFAIGACIKISGPNELIHQTGESNKEKGKREKEIEVIRELCGHKKCREIFDLILSSGKNGASSDFIQLKAWPNSTKNHRRDIHSYVCKIRKAIYECPECRGAIIYKDGKYFFVSGKEQIKSKSRQ